MDIIEELQDLRRPFDPDCLHCVLYRLAYDWVNNGRESPAGAVLKTAEALGHLISVFSSAADRRTAQRSAMKIVAETAEERARTRLLQVPPGGNA